MDLSKIYRHRFSDQEIVSLNGVWKVLVEDYFQHWIQPQDSVLDVGAGYCLFINNVTARRKVAVDANPFVAKYCGKDVTFVETQDFATADLGESFDVAFVSNFLEHLNNSTEVLAILSALHRLLKPSGRLIILQPNFALIGPKYFDFIDHKTILTDVSLLEALTVTGYDIVKFKRRFLPYTSKSRFLRAPALRAPWLVRLYLKLPPVQFLIGKQTLVIATHRAAPSLTAEGDHSIT